MIVASNEKFGDNVRITRNVVKYCHHLGVAVEAEVGHAGTALADDSTTYTEVKTAVDFVKETKMIH